MKHVGVLGLIVLSSSLLAAGCGGGATIAQPEPGSALDAPSGPTLTAGVGQATLSWEPVDGALGYRVFLAGAAGIPSTGSEGMPGARIDTVTADEVAHTFTALPAGRRYYAAVCAIGETSDSPLSTEVSALLAPGMPAGVQANGAFTAVVLEWPDVPGATRYDVFLSDEPVGSATWSESLHGEARYQVTSPLTVADLPNGVPYYFVVRAANEAGYGPDAAPAMGIPTAAGVFSSGDPVGTGTRPVEVAVGDLDGDGCEDLAVCDAIDGILTFYRCHPEGPPEFAGALPIEEPIEMGDPGLREEFPDPPGRHPMALGDLDGDGNLDLVASLGSGGGVVVFLGDGAFGFTQSDAFLSGADVRDLHLADVDEDGVPDLLAVDGNDEVLSVWSGQGDGTFESTGEAGLDAGPSRACVADLDGDGHLDVAVACTDADTVWVLVGDGSGAFEAVDPVATGDAPWDVVAGDVDGDGIRTSSWSPAPTWWRRSGSARVTGASRRAPIKPSAPIPAMRASPTSAATASSTSSSPTAPRPPCRISWVRATVASRWCRRWKCLRTSPDAWVWVT